MKCPKCNSERVRTTQTSDKEDGKITRRRRVCFSCSYQFNTQEFTQFYLDNLLHSLVDIIRKP